MSSYNKYSSRHFNTITFKDDIVVKSSTNTQKLLDELMWYMNIPTPLKMFIPSIYDVSVINNKLQLTMEHIKCDNLAMLYVNNKLTQENYKKIINKLLYVHYLFKLHKYFDDKKRKRLNTYLYEKKTKERLYKVNQQFGFISDKVVINNKEYTSISALENKIYKKIKTLLSNKISIIHGDLCFSNILYNIDANEVVLVDPRGNCGEQTIYGDSMYDLAKLRHSINGLYDFIKADKFKLEYFNNDFTFDIEKPLIYDEITQYYDKCVVNYGHDLNTIKFIEALLFATMIPLHSDNSKHQLAFYLIATMKFNEVNFDEL